MAQKKKTLYTCLNAAAVTIYEQWNYQDPSSGGLNHPYSTEAMEQCYSSLPGFEPAPPKTSSKSKLLFQWKGSHLLQWEFGSVLIQAVSLETCKAWTITWVLSFPLLSLGFFFGGRWEGNLLSWWRVGNGELQWQQRGKKNNCAFGKDIFITMH